MLLKKTFRRMHLVLCQKLRFVLFTKTVILRWNKTTKILYRVLDDTLRSPKGKAFIFNVLDALRLRWTQSLPHHHWSQCGLARVDILIKRKILGLNIRVYTYF